MIRAFLHPILWPLALLGILASVSAGTCNNNEPVIGIVSQALSDSSSIVKYYPWAKGKSYIAASYVKFIESSGARVVPIKDTVTDSELTTLLKSLNGVVFPGGALSLTTSNYSRVATSVYRYAMAAHDKGDYFPILGLCWGVQMLFKLAAGVNLLKRTYSSHVDLKVQFTEIASKSILFQDLPPSLKNLMTTQEITYNNHRWGLYTKSFDSNEKLTNFFNVLALSVDKRGVPFVAAVEAQRYPIYGLQWHPEKPLFEWKEQLNIGHSSSSLAASQFIANTFRKEASKSCNKFGSHSGDEALLIYNYSPINSAVAGSSFEQVYVI